MKLKLLVATLTVLLTTGGCTVHFPLADNGPTLQSSDDSQSASNLRLAPTEPDNRNPVKGNVSDSPD
jgi:hypothetical protein